MSQQTTSIKLSQEMRERINRLGASRKRSPHSLLVEAVENYVEHEEKREAWRQEGIDAYEEYMRTGLHVTHDEAKDWLRQLAAGTSTGAPKCHL